MTCVDLHLHSCYSSRPAEWFLKRLGTRESYTDIDAIYHACRKRGMTFVTLTDHNTIDGALELRRRYPEDTFVSAEMTAYFPENGCKIHVLVYDITRERFTEIDRLRRDIYALRDYLFDHSIVHSVAHATYDINDRLNTDLVEKLLLLFNTFEGINGARSPYYARQWMRLLSQLTEDDMARLEAKHGIPPRGETPWRKGLTGGSDDHAGLFQALTFTRGPEAATPAEFLAAVKEGKTTAAGRSHDFKTFAFSIYKIAYDFSKQKADKDANDLFSLLNQMLFEQHGAMIARTLIPGQEPEKQHPNQDASSTDKPQDRLLLDFLTSLARDISESEQEEMDVTFDRIYGTIASLVDNYFTMVMDSMGEALRNGSVSSFMKNLFASLPFFFLSTPFVTSLRHLARDRVIVSGLMEQMGKTGANPTERVFWFTDTIHDLNGVSVSLRQIAWRAFRTGRDLTMITCHRGGENLGSLPPNVMNLECVYAFESELYAGYTLHCPSLLKAIDRIGSLNPDRVVISTPGPVGLIGLLCARMLGIPCTGVYHTDFKTQLDLTIKDAHITAMACQYERLFFSRMDDIRVPSRAYIDILKSRNFPENRMRVFERGINTSLFRHMGSPCTGFTLIWAGRVSHDKNIVFLLDVYEKARARRPDLSLIMAGTGPDFNEIVSRTEGIPDITLLGRVTHEKLPEFYNSGDLFVFPSTMDTFGMVVLEAHACGIPALVSDIGGPQEIVEPGVTGQVLSLDEPQEWVKAILAHARHKDNDPGGYAAHKKAISRRILTRFNWENALVDLIGLPGKRATMSPEESLFTKSA